MKTQVLTALVGASFLVGCSGTGQTKTAATDSTKVPTLESGPVPIHNVGLRVHLNKIGKGYVLGKTGSFRFEQSIPGENAGVKAQCEIPIVFTITGPRKKLDAMISKTVTEVFSKMGQSLKGTTQEFTTGFFTVSGTELSPLVQSTPDSLLGKYEMQALPGLAKFGPGADSAPVNSRAIGFALPVGTKFTDKVTLTLDLSPQDDAGTSALCQQILKSGFKVEAPKTGA